MSVSANIRRLCKELNISQKDLAKLANLPASTISSALKEGSDPRASTIKNIVIALGVSSDMVLFDDEELGLNGDLKILFREVERFEGKEREQLKDMLRMMIVHNKSKELMK
ncbi:MULTISPECIES: helix-turn-helix domain-containing protein [Acinetobacter]|uniref:helix-turn-helix domain-containing protein n=1 Tax=Acinetobacter TaxID=469 RepID=UPI0015D29AAE|nr:MULTISPECIES: helix-turn-helix transcriptional regulator [Acinetobacter]MCO8060293.1 helix-turn-helix transcriptional regulator [Acinetobacter towneri]MCO8065943.1 helix-turn-helix transcriptional regulator [Acinetobacter towneri]MDC4563636.1 helix-turn-helix transcriptional regulator [Acinetobacter baumannii]MDD2946260.1 helix-turn-helix transcriptional regulator [Acinetobacter sp.]